MDLPLILLLEGFLFIVVFQGMSLLRREGVSGRFALEGLVLTGLVAWAAWLHWFIMNPLIFLLIIYLLCMRTRLLLDLGNLLAQSGRFSQAEKLYALTGRLYPDAAGREVVELNRATSALFQGKVEEAAAAFRTVIERAKSNHLGDRYQAAAHYNLGAAYRKQGNEAKARQEFTAVIDLLPISEFARNARLALGRDKKETR
jgi:tetratricopeptide (TPR) repeat protein